MELPKGAVAERLPEPEEGTRRERYPRSKWPPGPWDQEPFDKVSWVDEETNLDCLAVRGPMGSWCGYVGVPPGHPFYGKDYADCTLPTATPQGETAINTELGEKLGEKYRKHLEERLTCGEEYCNHSPQAMLDVHGGITYAGACQGNICHHTEGRPEVTWFGFDTGHYGDAQPGMLVNSAEMHVKGHDIFTDHLFWDPEAGAIVKYTEHPEYYRRIDYVIGEVQSLAKQLKGVAGGPSA